MASYPTAVVTLPNHSDNTDTIFAADINTPNAEIIAVETGLLSGVQHALKPLTDDTFDLGDVSHAFKNLWTKGTVQLNGIVYTFPSADGTTGQVLETDGSRNLSWATPSANVPDLCEFRLTLTSGLPVTTSDVTAATTLLFSPITGNRITVQDGSGNKTLLTSAEISISIPATTTTVYDVFVFNSSGTLTLELLSWTNDTSRATALSRSNGQLTKSGDTTRLYVGSVRTTGVSGQTEDSVVNRFVWNYYHRVDRPLQRFETTASWAYTTNTIRQANGATANQVNVLIGVSEDPVVCDVMASLFQGTSTNNMAVGIGLDSTTAFASNQSVQVLQLTGNQFGVIRSQYRGFPGIGKHSLMWNEVAAANGTTTWYGATTTVNAIALAASVESGLLGVMKG